MERRRCGSRVARLPFVSEQPIRRALAPGSYDPLTVGHVDVIRRAAALYDELIVAVLHNPAKAGTFTIEERLAFIEAAVADLPGQQGRGATIRVEAFADRLLVDVCRDLDVPVVIKGLRSGTDFAYELPMALMNKHLTGLETVFLPGDPALEHVSSSLVKEVVRLGGEVRGLVPDAVHDALLTRLRGQA